MGRARYLDHEHPLAFAHRGGAGDWPENTMPAFEGAVALGFRYVETDVHVTDDGVLLAFHDDRLDRVTNRTGLIRDLPWREVSKALVDGREPIPKLADLLHTWPELRINIDPKHDSAVQPLIDVIRAADAVDRVCVGSFSDARIRRCRTALGGGLCTALGPGGVTRLRAASFGVPTGPIRADCAQVPVRQAGIPIVDARLIRAAHRRGIQVHVWTIDDAQEMARLLDLGVDGIMTDRPALLREVLIGRGQWDGPT